MHGWPLQQLPHPLCLPGNLRSKLLGRTINASGRTIVDEQGAMLLADGASMVEEDAGLRATEIRAQWRVA